MPKQTPQHISAEQVAATSTQIAKHKSESIQSLIERCEPEFNKALAQVYPVERFMRAAITAVQLNPQLAKCEPRSLLGALMQSAQLGLPVDAALGFAYLVPFKNKVQLIPGYKGLIQLAHRSGKVSGVKGYVVFDDDEFDYWFGTKARVHHKPALRTEAVDAKNFWQRCIAAYAVVHYRDGSEQFDVMSAAEVQQAMNRNPAVAAGKHTAWKTDPWEMAKKTPTRRLLKWTPLSVETQVAVSLDERASIGVDQNLELLAPPAPDALPVELVPPELIESEAVGVDEKG